MTGRAVILLVAGIAMIAGIIMHRVEATSSRIAENYSAAYQRQCAQNIAHTGVNLALRSLSSDRTSLAGFGTPSSPYAFLGGTAYVKIDTAIMYQGISTYRITSTAYTQASTIGDTNVLKTSYTSIAYVYFPPGIFPTDVKGLLTLHSSNTVNGSITIDGRDHPDGSTAVNPLQGTFGVWTTASSFSISGSAIVGGTSAGKDSVPVATGAAIALNQTMSPAYPGSPDSVMGGAANGYPEGTLKAVARDGLFGSQYVTDPTKLHYPLSGITYVDLPPGGAWTGASMGSGNTGILVVHSSAKDAVFKSAAGSFSGIIISDDMTNFHGTLWGAIVTLTTTPAGNILGNGSAAVYYSQEAIGRATSGFAINSGVRIAGWYE